MQIITKEEFNNAFLDFVKRIDSGSIFIYPTDTIYGIGCDATNEVAVEKVREAKSRERKPFSVIAPSKEWIVENCVLSEEAEEWVKKLPGPYTLILPLKDPCVVASNVSGTDTLGVRIPDHWFSQVASKLNKPIVTTSANKVGENFMTSLDNLNSDVRDKVEFILYEGEKEGRPSTLVDLRTEETTTTAR